MDFQHIFFLIWASVLIYIVVTFYVTGKNAMKIFPKLDTNKIIFRERNASGYSTKTKMTQMGGSNGLLDVIIVGEELWLTSFTFLAGIGERFDLLHRIRKKDVSKIKREKKRIKINFVNHENKEKEVVLILKNPDDFIQKLSR